MPKVRIEANDLKFDVPLVDILFTPTRIVIDHNAGDDLVESEHALDSVAKASNAHAIVENTTIIDIMPHPDWDLKYTEVEPGIFQKVQDYNPKDKQPPGDIKCDITVRNATDPPQPQQKPLGGSSSPASSSSESPAAPAAEASSTASASPTTTTDSKPATPPTDEYQLTWRPKYGWVVARRSDMAYLEATTPEIGALILRQLITDNVNPASYDWTPYPSDI